MAAAENLGNFDEVKNDLQNHVEYLKFVDDETKLKYYSCCACGKLAIMHCIANCRCIFCNKCYLKYYEKPCPHCKDTVKTNSQDPDLDRAVFELKVECKFKKNGCETIVELRHFLNHICVCKSSTEKLLPKLYKEDKIADALQQLNDGNIRINQVIESMQAENGRICDEFLGMKESLKNSVNLQIVTLKKLSDEIHNKDATGLMQAEIMQINNSLEKNEEAIKALKDANNNQIEKIQGLTEAMQTEIMELKKALRESGEVSKILKEESTGQVKKIVEIHKLLTSNELQNKNATEQLQTEILQLKLSLKNIEEKANVLQDETNCQINKLQMEQGRLSELMKSETMQLKKALQKSDEATKGLQEENNNQMKNVKENQKLLTDNDRKNKKAIEHMQTEINLLKDALKKSKEEIKENQTKHKLTNDDLQIKQTIEHMQSEINQLQAEHKREIKKIENQQIKQLEELETKLGTKFHNELTECQYRQEGELISSLPVVNLWKVEGIREKLSSLMREQEYVIKSDEFLNVSDTLKFRPLLFRGSENNCVYINLDFVVKLSGDLPYVHSRKYVLLDQSDSPMKNNIELIDRPEFGMNSREEVTLPRFTFSRFFPISLLKGENRYLKNDQILIMIIFEPISFLYKNVASSDGILLWRINNYSKKKRDEINLVQHCIISKPFKTSEAGYLLQVQLYLNGHNSGKGKFLSIYSRVILGENDAFLPCPFTYKCSYYLLDQSDSHSKNDKTGFDSSVKFERRNSCSGFHQFVLQSQAEDPKYLKCDSLLIIVVAQAC